MSKKENAIRVIIADNQTVARLGTQAILSQESHIEVIGEASSGLEALQLID